MELKVLCDCGQKFKFDVDPVNGRMPFTVNCPVCNEDATAKANSLISEKLASVPPMAAAENPTPPPPTAPVTGGLRIHRSSAPAPTLVAPTAPSGDDAPPPIGAVRPFAMAAALNPPKKSSFGMGLLGAFVGALVGSIVYFLIFKYTGLHFKLLALGVGALAGWFTDFLGKGEGSKELGGITAVLVVAGIIGAQYIVALGWWHEGTEETLENARMAYQNAVAEAHDVVKMVPTGSDAEIRAYLVKQAEGEGDKAGASDFSNDDVKDFRENQLPEYQGMASGRITKDEYESNHEIKTTEAKVENNSEDGTFKAVFLLLFFTKVNIFSLVAAAALAFKLSTNA